MESGEAEGAPLTTDHLVKATQLLWATNAP